MCEVKVFFSNIILHLQQLNKKHIRTNICRVFWVNKFRPGEQISSNLSPTFPREANRPIDAMLCPISDVKSVRMTAFCQLCMSGVIATALILIFLQSMAESLLFPIS